MSEPPCLVPRRKEVNSVGNTFKGKFHKGKFVGQSTPTVTDSSSRSDDSQQCSNLGFSPGTESHGECVLRLRELATQGALLAAAEAETKRQKAEIARLQRIAEQAEKDRALDAAINIFGTIASGRSIFAPPSRSSSNNVGLSGLRNCNYSVGMQTATRSQSALISCPATMDFGGVTGFLKP